MLMVLLCGYVIVHPRLSCSDVSRIVRVESTPSGANAYLLRGTQRIPLGKTPLDYRAEFHSDQSILRIAFEHPGYRPARLELSASQSRLMARLAAKRLVADPTGHSDPALRSLQQTINPALTQALSATMQRKSDRDVELVGEARLHRIGNHTLLVVPLSVTFQGPTNGQVADIPAKLKVIWEKAALPVVLAVTKAVGRVREIDGIVIESFYGPRRRDAQSGYRVEHGVELQCVAGADKIPVKRYCAQRDSYGRCVGDNDWQLVHNPCVSRQPTTVTKPRFDQSSLTTRYAIRVKYLVPRSADVSKLEFSHVDVVAKDAGGKLLWKQDKFADSFSK